jgi:molybdenum cofactor cytidylyltransferase
MGSGPVVGVLLAAGSAQRFGADKLLAKLSDGAPMGVRALEHLIGAVDEVVAVLRPGDDALAAALRGRDARITVCPDAAHGMGVSLAWGVRAAPAAGGWIIALADMPWIRSETIGAVANALRSGAAIVAPEHDGARGHPVGFARRYYGELAALSGDEGAKKLLEANAVALLKTGDPGVLRDVDAPSDLAG